MSKLTVIVCSYIIILTGNDQTKRKTEKTCSFTIYDLSLIII